MNDFVDDGTVMENGLKLVFCYKMNDSKSSVWCLNKVIKGYIIIQDKCTFRRPEASS